MINQLFRYTKGWVEFSFYGENIGKTISQANGEGLLLWKLVKQNSQTKCCCYAREYKKIAKIARHFHCRMKVLKRHGAPFLLHRYRYRWGVAAGIVAGLLFLFAMSCFVWTVDVNGNYTVPSQTILELAEKNGLKKGAFKYGLDFNSIEYQLKKELGEFAWVSINQIGTHVTIEVSESNPKPDIINLNDPCNVIAKYDGIIRTIEPYGGNAVVKPGDVVKAGDLLVSGVVEDSLESVHYYHAYAKVVAEVEHALSFTQDFESERRTFTGEEKQFRYFSIFGFHIPLFFGGTGEERIVSETEYSNFRLFGIQLPFGIETRNIRYYQTEHLSMSEEEARRMLIAQAKQKETELFAEAKILSRREEFQPTATGISLQINYLVEEDIGEQQAIEVHS